MTQLQTLTNGPLHELISEAGTRLGLESGFVRGLGFVRSARVRVGDCEVVVSSATVVGLNATVHTGSGGHVRATGTFSYSSGGIPVVVAGEVVEADVESLECWFDGVPAPTRAPVDAPPPRHAKPAVAPAPAPAPAPPSPAKEKTIPKAAPKPKRSSAKLAAKPKASPSDWARVVAASQNLVDEDDGEVDVDELERGGLLLHPSLNECTILAVISDDAVKVRLPNGSVRKLVMRNFRVFADGDGRYRVEKRAER